MLNPYHNNPAYNQQRAGAGYLVGRAARYAYDRYVAAPAAGAAPPPSSARPPRRQTRRKQPSKKTKSVKKDVQKLKKSVHSLQKMDDNTTGTMTYRKLHSGEIISAVHHHKIFCTGIIDTTAYEDVLGQCKFFDPATPGTLTTASQSAGTYARQSLVQSVTNKVYFRNNYQTDADVTVYLCSCKDDTDQLPNVLWTSGIADQGYGNLLTTNSDLGQYPSDYDTVKDIWNLKVAFKGTLSPGQSATVSNTIKDIEYSPSTVDAHNLAYQREYKAQVYMFQVRGCLSHDQEVSTNTTFQQGGIDFYGEISFKVKYNAGINISYIYVQDDSDASFVGNPVCSNQPVADNQTYSTA